MECQISFIGLYGFQQEEAGLEQELCVNLSVLYVGQQLSQALGIAQKLLAVPCSHSSSLQTPGTTLALPRALSAGCLLPEGVMLGLEKLKNPFH